MNKHSDEPELPQADALKAAASMPPTAQRKHVLRTIGKTGKPPASETMPDGHPLAGMRVVLESETDEHHEMRRKRLLREAAEADANASENPAEKGQWESEAARLRGLAGSAVWHAESDAADAGYSEDAQMIGRRGRFYITATNPATGDRLAWKAGVYKSRADRPDRSAAEDPE